MAMELANPQTGLPQVKTPEMNDRDRINDILSYEKYMSYGFNTGLHEMQNPQLHQTVARILGEVNEMQFKLFNAMFEKGWYKMKTADTQEIGQANQQFANYRSQFPQF